MWCLVLLVHEVLEGRVTTLLKQHAVIEALLQHRVHFCLQVKQLLGERQRILDVVIVVYYSLAALLDVRIHLLDDEAKRLWVSLKYYVHQIEFLEPRIVEHVLTACFLFYDRLGFLGDELIFNDL